jgi:CheY-like chemotaxis protein
MSTVLLVDDEKNVLKTLSISLKRYDFAVHQAQSGPDALKLLDESPCDFVVSDIRMAPMDGYKLASAIRRRFPEMQVIFMSAFGIEDAGSLPDDLAGFPRLTKPFPVAELVRLLHDKEKEKRVGSLPRTRAARILFFDEGRRGEDVAARLRALEFDVDLSAPDPADESSIDWKRYDLFALDERVLEGGRWILLNRIDQYAPGKPVLVISDREKPRSNGAWNHAAAGVIPRDVLLREAAAARALILNHIKSE